MRIELGTKTFPMHDVTRVALLDRNKQVVCKVTRRSGEPDMGFIMRINMALRHLSSVIYLKFTRENTQPGGWTEKTKTLIPLNA